MPEYERQALAIREKAYALDEGTLSPVEVREALETFQKQVDVLLNKAYRDVLLNLKKTDPQLATLFQNEQRAWLKFVESFCSKAQEHFGEGGTMYLTSAMYTKLNFWVEQISWFRIINRSLVFEDAS